MDNIEDFDALGARMWWWGENNEQKGPLNTLDLVMRMLSGKLSLDTLVWTDSMEGWDSAENCPTLMSLVDMLQRRSHKSYTAPPGDHEVPPACSQWIAALSKDARSSLFHTALNKYSPAIVKGHENARDALLAAFISRQPEMEDDANSYEMSDEFLMDVLDQCEGVPKRDFERLLVEGNEQHVHTLLHSAAHLDKAFMTRIHNACLMGEARQCIEQGDIPGMLSRLKTKPALIHARNIDGTCLLHSIVKMGKLDVLQAVLAWQKEVADVFVVNFDCLDLSHNTPLHVAATSGNVAMVEVLLEAGADVNVQNRNQSEYASGQWNARVNGGDFTVPICPEHATPLHIAAEQCDIDLIAALLKAKPDLEVPDSSGMTPLHIAVEAGDEECSEALLAAGANPASTNPSFGEGVTCLHSAASRGLAGIVASILQHCPDMDVDAPDAEGWRPLHLAARKGSAKVIELLLKHGANSLAVNKHGQNALYLAQVNNKSAAVALLTTAAT